MKRLIVGTCTLPLLLVGLAASPGQAANGYPNWGQEVKDCNHSACYPYGTTRGVYVRDQARDGQGPGYAWEIHTLAHPGKSASW